MRNRLNITWSQRLAAFLFTCIVLTLVTSLLFPKLRKNADVGVRQSPNKSSAVDLLNQRQAFLSTIDRQSIETLSTRPDGQITLCSAVGDEGNGVDRITLRNIAGSLLKQKHVEALCLVSFIRRVDLDLLRNERTPSEIDEGPAKLLKANAFEVSNILRSKYLLGTVRADTNILPLVEYLSLSSSCSDIAATIAAQVEAADPSHLSFEKTYRAVCRQIR